jgi:hypothetical protein
MNRLEQSLHLAVLAVDPGTTRSAICRLSPGGTPECERLENDHLLRRLRGASECGDPAILVIEQVEHYGTGMPIGRDVLETVYWSGRFCEAWERGGGRVERLPRRVVKLHLCGTSRAKDPNVRQALIDRWGGQEDAIGRKATAGPLYGIAGDEWAATAVAVTYLDQIGVASQQTEGVPCPL